MLREVLYFEDVVYRVDSLFVYKNLKRDSIIKVYRDMSECIAKDPDLKGVNLMYCNFVSMLVSKAEELGLTGNIFKKYCIHLFLNDVNEFSIACEKNMKTVDTSLYKLVLKDLAALQFFMEFDLKNLCENIGYGEKIYEYTPLVVGENAFFDQIEAAQAAPKMAEELTWYYKKMGAGEFATCKMYKYDENDGIIGIKKADPTIFSDIIGYDEQKKAIKSNIEAFINGSPANNVLLVGSRGTGKSSCVKAIANEYFERGLRLIDISKDQAQVLPKLLKQLEKRGKYFVIFMDDLSYNDFEVQYKYLKSILEGSVEIRPKNVIFYATSNRRHIIEERWIDKQDNSSLDEEIHLSDAINEKLSLSDRFGVVVTFPQPSQTEFISIVTKLAKKMNLNISEDFLKAQANKWALNAKSFSGRTAKQFIDHIVWEVRKG